MSKTVSSFLSWCAVMPSRGTMEGSTYQLISGFRRTTVRDDLTDDEAAFHASVLENSQRKTYSDIDRAYLVREYEARNYATATILNVMRVGERQLRPRSSETERA